MPTLLGLLGLFAIPFAIVFGLAVGLAIAAFQLWATRRAAETTKPSPLLQVLIGMPLRVGVPALVFVLLLKISLWALVAALVAFQFGRGLLVPYFEAPKR